MPLTHRLQVRLDDEHHARITRLAQERGVSVATIVREAIDRGLADSSKPRRAAGRRLLEAEDMPVPSTAALRAELDAARAGGG
jgi:predicted transcriptional regulator